MVSSSLLLILRAALLCLSFFGLCAAARDTLKLHRFIAPYFVASSIICVLMFAGMLHVLKYGFYLLYFGGFAGAIAALAKRLLRRERLALRRSDGYLIAIGALVLIYIIWRLGPSYLHERDDLSHWSIVARHLLKTDAFPDASAVSVTFQSYPVGAAAFIYYVCRTLGNQEGLWLIAQNVLYVLLFMPMLAHVRGNRKWILPVLTALFVLLFKHTRPMESLYVDWLLSFFGFGSVAAVLYHRDEPFQALLCALPGAIAVTLFKNSGIFFAAVTGCALGIAVSGRKGRRFGWLCFLICMAASVVAFLLWNLHVKQVFPAGLETKHAVSLTTYAARLGSKDLSLILRTFKKMVMQWLQPDFYQIQGLLFILLGSLSMYLTARRRPELRIHLKPSLQAFGLILIAYAAWYLMLYMTYIFSMQASEARSLAAFDRYNGTGLLLMEGLSLIVLLDFFARDELAPRVHPTALCAGAVAAILLTSALVKPGDYLYWFYPELTQRRVTRCDFRQTAYDFMQEYDLPQDRCYLVCAGSVAEAAANGYYGQAYFDMKFELDSPYITVVGRITGEDGTDSYLYGKQRQKEYVADPISSIMMDLDSFDAILILQEDPEFDGRLAELLEDYDGDLPIVYP